MKIGPLAFRPRFTLTIIALALVSLFIRLGLWQLERADEKHALKQAIKLRRDLPPLVLREWLEMHSELRYRKVVARGTFEPNDQIFLDNRTHQGRAGYHIVTPLRLSDAGVRVLVNRGWVEMGRTRDELPVVPTPEGEVEVHGVIEIPSAPPLVLGHTGAPGPSWDKRWAYLDLDYYKDHAGYLIEPFLILQDPGDPGGFVRLWPQLNVKHEMHIGYAIQWFAFAVIVLGVYLRMLLNRNEI